MGFKILAKRTASFSFGVTLLAGTMLSAGAYAQSPPDAGALRQQIERERAPALPQRNLSVPGGPAEMQAQGAAKITVTRFVFEGNTLLSGNELSAAVAGYIGRPVTFAELQNAAAAVGEAYRAKGRIVRAFLPQQDIVGGVVTIRIVEAKFGQTKIESETAGPWLAPQRAAAMIAAQQPGGQPVDTNRLDRALLLMDDLPGVTASGRLQPGKAPGETDLAVKLGSEPVLTGFGAVDNEGARATGYARVHGNVQLLSPLGAGDLSSVYLLASRGMRYAQVEESLPVGNDGLRIGVNASALDYDILPSEFDALDGKGNSLSAGLEASYPVIRARKRNLYIDANYDHRRFSNDSLGATTSEYDTDSITARLRGNIFDGFGGGGVTLGSFAATAGDLDQGTLNTGEDPDLDGGYSKFNYSLTRQQTITKTVSAYSAVSGQFSADKKLDSSEMFYLGGPNGVRAYPVNEGSGVNGVMANLELRWRFAPDFQLTGFYDHGHVGNHGAVKSYSLKGAGLELAWQNASGFDFRATWAHRIGSNPNPAADGDDQDGSSVKNRFWLTLSKQF